MRVRKVLGEYAGNGFVAFLAGGLDSAVADKNVIVVVNDRGRNESEFTQGASQLCNLLLAVRPGVPGIGHQLINGYLF